MCPRRRDWMCYINLSKKRGWYAIVKSVLILYANKQLLTFKENVLDAKQFRQEIETSRFLFWRLIIKNGMK